VRAPPDGGRPSDEPDASILRLVGGEVPRQAERPCYERSRAGIIAPRSGCRPWEIVARACTRTLRPPIQDAGRRATGGIPRSRPISRYENQRRFGKKRTDSEPASWVDRRVVTNAADELGISQHFDPEKHDRDQRTAAAAATIAHRPPCDQDSSRAQPEPFEAPRPRSRAKADERETPLLTAARTPETSPPGLWARSSAPATHQKCWQGRLVLVASRPPRPPCLRCCCYCPARCARQISCRRHLAGRATALRAPKGRRRRESHQPQRPSASSRRSRRG